jgi:hypothetical protein
VSGCLGVDEGVGGEQRRTVERLGVQRQDSLRTHVPSRYTHYSVMLEYIRKARVYAAYILVMICGCYSYDRVPVLVIDAATKAPIPGARVYTAYNVGLFHSGPRETSAITGEDGVALLLIAKDPEGAGVGAAADEYFSGAHTLYRENWPDEDHLTIALRHKPK